MSIPINHWIVTKTNHCFNPYPIRTNSESAVTADRCVNAIRLKGLFEDDRFALSFRDALERLQQNRIAAGMRECSNEICAERRQRMDHFAPHCNWLLYRDWALMAKVCHA